MGISIPSARSVCSKDKTVLGRATEQRNKDGPSAGAGGWPWERPRVRSALEAPGCPRSSEPRPRLTQRCTLLKPGPLDRREALCWESRREQGDAARRPGPAPSDSDGAGPASRAAPAAGAGRVRAAATVKTA